MTTIRVTTVFVQYCGCLSCKVQVAWQHTATQLLPSIEIRPGISYMVMVVARGSSASLRVSSSLWVTDGQRLHRRVASADRRGDLDVHIRF